VGLRRWYRIFRNADYAFDRDGYRFHTVGASPLAGHAPTMYYLTHLGQPIVPLDYLDPRVCIRREGHGDRKLVFCDRDGRRLDKLPWHLPEDAKPEDYEARDRLEALLRNGERAVPDD
jgi:hypothetical protein